MRGNRRRARRLHRLLAAKVLFTEGEDSYTTQNDSITFTAQKISGVAVGAKDKTWREKAQFDTEDEAYSWLKTKAGIVAA